MKVRKAHASERRPILAVTLGDPAGTGPELITRALALPAVRRLCRPIVVGDAAVLERAARITGSGGAIRPVASVAEASFAPDGIDVLDMGLVDVARLEPGKVQAMAGDAAFRYVLKAAGLALSGEVAGIVTSALNKEAMNLAGHHHDGHTGLLAEVCGSPGATMMLVAGRLRVSHVSTHVSLRQAVERVRAGRIVKVIELTAAALASLGIPRPRIAVAGLNPHAGENGLFGDEEKIHIEPAVARARELGHEVSGPWAGDTVFFRTMRGEFDAAVAMYHDQGHVAAKMLGIWRGVNVTLGLPIVRTSVEHGTDFRNAGTGRGDPRSLIAAIKLGARLGRERPPVR